MSLPPNINTYRRTISDVPLREVAFGSTTVYLFAPENLDEAQLGYSRDPEGKSLCGENDGDWKREWLVVGYEDLCGDPIFVDSNIETLPVYTAPHGEGAWEPMLIADTFAGFVEGLKAVSAVAQGRENPVELENNPLPSTQRKQALAKIRHANPHAEMDFWVLWLNEGDGYAARFGLVVHSGLTFLRRLFK